jgi:hypothetical protein
VLKECNCCAAIGMAIARWMVLDQGYRPESALTPPHHRALRHGVELAGAIPARAIGQSSTLQHTVSVTARSPDDHRLLDIDGMVRSSAQCRSLHGR